MNNNKELWKEERLAFDLKYPDENVIRFLLYCAQKFSANNRRILDFGCGSGRNTWVMAELGFDICAMDYNRDCLELTKQKLNGYEQIEYVMNEELVVPKPENDFDQIVANGVLFYLNRNSEQKLLLNLARVLKVGGFLFADYRTKDDALYGRGRMIEPDLYELDETCGSLCGIQYAFRDADEIKHIYTKNGFEIIKFERIDHYMENCTIKYSHYLIWAKKVRTL